MVSWFVATVDNLELAMAYSSKAEDLLPYCMEAIHCGTVTQRNSVTEPPLPATPRMQLGVVIGLTDDYFNMKGPVTCDTDFPTIENVER